MDINTYIRWSPWLANQLAQLTNADREQVLLAAQQQRNSSDWLPLLQQTLQSLPAADSRQLLELARGVDEQWQVALRQLRRREQCRFIIRLLAGTSPLPELTRELSDFADACIAAAINQAHQEVAILHGQPIGQDSSTPQTMVVIGMGKLGGQELNLSSDIDLIFTYAEEGETDGRRSISNQEFFIKVGQRAIALLDAITADGFVFRVDMRLRPWGDGSALACGFDALEAYYERHGREWERYALVKARICAGDTQQGETMLQSLRPFVYRRYIDFGAFESLRDMKQMIAREVRRLDREDNIKLGAGGIREVEFVAQAFQLIRGGVDRSLQLRPLLQVLPELAARELLPQRAVDELTEAYYFLRNSEHIIQAQHDQQTQMLPTIVIDRVHLAQAMGFDDWDSYAHALSQHRNKVHVHFQNVIVLREEASSAEEEPECWPDRVASLLASRAVMQLSGPARDRLDRLLPRLVAACDRHEQGDVALARVMPLIETTLKRSAYLVMLIENPEALTRLVDLCACSPWIAESLTRYPVLLDELLNARTLFSPPSREELTQELRQQLMRVPADDLEQQMDVLRIFQKGQVLRVAASDIKGTLPLMKISDYLTWIAEAVLEEVLVLSWQQLTQRHGRPKRADGSDCDLDFVIVGYGKLGGLELGYGSDLDLVFIHDADPQSETDGAKSIDAASFYARLGQKIIHLLTTAMGTGTLYEVDMRLRPSGASGLLVTSLSGFASYQREHAWTWEHQALVRARVVAGDPRVAEGFNAVRAEIIGREREQTALKNEVLEMREKMRSHLAPKDPDEIDIKHSPGGLVDIEFLVQYLTLAHAAKVPALRQWPDNVRLLEVMAEESILTHEDAENLRQAYLDLRGRSHRQALAAEGRAMDVDDLLSARQLVAAIWQRIMVE
ncbi:MAG: bifunctional [glutamate--ammonia ligase]-adenylyl-L-tyrosine phosphorylase/[glutamate--ammonia-ligase] adenylyltransferase [Moraxellaceae bacterium]|nr:bifunctional [glutamate--ammonia ligase]-adenylyl-L-tyrosine phosphorylase/[glutamate--ammonia-ligase] adenylyltransferase [Moraxellaceae bacterium]MDZ4386739.1 bifunctional [glutamate--ammonia ligase]-adenylyl-L-tyrosine phosphorylase/[glutamate--ammonia-ligase] adenylyltransferase [Moraxellaceae bacterium]